MAYMNEVQRVALVGGVRTPFVKAGGAFRNHTALELGTHVVDSLMQRFDLSGEQVQELAYGTVLLDPRTTNAAREIVLRSEHLSPQCYAQFVSNNCVTGLVALSWIFDAIRSRRINCGIAAGAESMSTPTLTLDPKGERAWTRLGYSRSKKELAKSLFGLLSSPKRNFVPQAPSPKEPSTGLTMGEHCELMAKEFEIARKAQDQWAYDSHMNAWNNYAQVLEEVVAFNGVGKDNIIRPKTTVERLARLKPVFDKKSGNGTLTAGNSSPLTDGASAVCLMAQEELGDREALAYIEDIEFSAIDPADGLLMAPAVAVARLLKKNGKKVSDIDVFEIHEAFSAQVLANLKVWENGWEKYPEVVEVGAIPHEKINPNGGSIALGHPFAATGGRLLTAMAHHFRRGTAKTGVISVCAGGAMACAVLMSKH